MSIVAQKSLMARYARMLAIEEKQPASKLLKFQTTGKPEVILAFTIKDWDLASPTAASLAADSVDLHADWVTGGLITAGPDDAVLDGVSARMIATDTWLVALVSERAVEHDRLVRILETASRVGRNRRVGVLPVRFEVDEWEPPAVYSRWPRIEEIEGRLRIFGPGTPDKSYPLRRWFHSDSVRQHYEMR